MYSSGSNAADDLADYIAAAALGAASARLLSQCSLSSLFENGRGRAKLPPPTPPSLHASTQEDESLQNDILEGKCLLTARESKLFTFNKPQVLKVIQGKAQNATFHINIDNGGWVSMH